MTPRRLLRDFCFAAAVALIAAAPGPRASGDDWQALVRQLGVEETHDAALIKLRSMNDLGPKLAGALDSKERALALNAIAALRFTGLTGDVLSNALKTGSWMDFAVLNSFCDDPRIRTRLNAAYSRLLDTDALRSSTSLVAVLDGIDRMDGTVAPGRLEQLLDDPAYPVRLAAIASAARLSLRSEGGAYAPVLRKAMRISPYQARVAAMYAVARRAKVSRNPAEISVDRETARAQCASEKRAETRRSCRELLAVLR